MNVGLPSETIKNAAIRIKELERENAALRGALVKAMDALKSGCEHESFAAWARASRVLDAARKEQP
jgi:hypothetical protein